MTKLDALNSMSAEAAKSEFLRCCGSSRWATAMAARRPFATEGDLVAAGSDVWRGLSRADWLEAFAAHPKIGDLDPHPFPLSPRGREGRRKFSASAAWSAEEQGKVNTASQATLQTLAERNQQYESRFGYIFIVCATGKSADEMLALLDERLPNEPDVELPIAAAEQEKITQLRLHKLCL